MDVGGNNRDRIFNAIPSNITENIHPSNLVTVWWGGYFTSSDVVSIAGMHEWRYRLSTVTVRRSGARAAYHEMRWQRRWCIAEPAVLGWRGAGRGDPLTERARCRLTPPVAL